MKTDQRYVCTKDDPWNPSKGKRGFHPDAILLYTDRDWIYEMYRCPHCGLQFTVELADA